jgi:hypothetical protein
MGRPGERYGAAQLRLPLFAGNPYGLGAQSQARSSLLSSSVKTGKKPSCQYTFSPAIEWGVIYQK